MLHTRKIYACFIPIILILPCIHCPGKLGVSEEGAYYARLFPDRR
jgi:hypothetical protein